MNIYHKLKVDFSELIKREKIGRDDIALTIKTLTPEEAIGNPKRRDYPLLIGKEALLEADYKGYKGQAFSSARTSFRGKVEDLMTLQVGEDEYDTALFIAAMNAVYRSFGLIEGTVHCFDEEPETCASCILNFLKRQYRAAKLLLVGYQPSFLESLSEGGMTIRCLDLNPDNVGEKRYGVLVEDGKLYAEAIAWSDMVLATGSMITNGSIVHYLDLNKPTFFYGTTIAAPAAVLGLNRLCFESH